MSWVRCDAPRVLFVTGVAHFHWLLFSFYARQCFIYIYIYIFCMNSRTLNVIALIFIFSFTVSDVMWPSCSASPFILPSVG
jgi:hypothetical protein